MPLYLFVIQKLPTRMLWAQEVLEAQAPGLGAELAAIQRLILLRSAQLLAVWVALE
jgi:hypothetical protein